MKQNKVIKRASDLINDFLEDAKNPNFDFFQYRDSFYHIFYRDTNQLYEELKDVFPPKEIGKIGQFIRKVTSTAGYSQSHDLPPIIENFTRIKTYLDTPILRDTILKIFYSWQSDLTSKYNRGFIGDAIKSAIKIINSRHNLNIEFDSDTRGEPGSPDISNKILEKINNSFIFIADVSFVTNLEEKGMPNPNVMFELGYAMSVLTDKNVVMVFNKRSGDISKMPFDLGFKRQLVYSYDETDIEKATERNNLAQHFTASIETILKSSGII